MAWALRLWEWYVAPTRGWGQDARALPRDWYCHPFDRTNDEFARQVRRNSVGPLECNWDELVMLPSGERVWPWAIFFAHWHVFLIAELLEALPLFSPVLNLPQARETIGHALANYEFLKASSDLRVSAVQRHWRQVAPAFEWLSRFRTLRGAAADLQIPYRVWGMAAAQMLADLGMSRDEVRTSFRDELLVAWQRWQWLFRHTLPAACHAGLREEIDLASELVESALNEDLDPTDEFWRPRDPNQRRWARLQDALPREDWEAQSEFGRTAPIYLSDYDRVMPEALRCRSLNLEQLARQGWTRSVSFRRLCLALTRLWEHHRGFPPLVGPDLQVRNPMDYLLVCALILERWLAEALAENLSYDDLSFRALADEGCRKLATVLSVEPSSLVALVGTLRDGRCNLRDLPTNPRDPFLALEDIPAGDVEEYVARCVVNCEIMRNYAAHHDCLDWELMNLGLARIPLQSMLSLLVIWLSQLVAKQ